MVEGERFYYNDGFLFPINDQDVVGALQLNKPSVFDYAVVKGTDILLELKTHQKDSYDVHTIYLTKEAIENIMAVFNSILGEK